MQPSTFIWLIPFYLIGTIPCGVLIARQYGIDVTRQGSGNVGATNVARVVGKKAGAITLVCDLLKGFIPLWISFLLWRDVSFISAAAVALVAGHCFSIPGKLKGGKGVATGLGAMLYLSPLTALLTLSIFGLVAKKYRMVSLASISAAILAPVFALLLNEPQAIPVGLMLVSAIIVFRHRENLQRLTEGTENKF